VTMEETAVKMVSLGGVLALHSLMVGVELFHHSHSH